MERYNSEGNLIAKTEEGIQNFWKWFGDSKVVDKQGRPLVVYHGTNAGFDTFEKDRIGDFGKGYYFTTSRENAEQYSARKGGDIVMPVYLSIKNVYKAPGNAGQFLYNLRDKKTSAKQAQGVLLEQGFDGIEIKQFNGKEKYFVAFEPNQIKSVNNKGTFNPNSSNIYESIENKIIAYHGSNNDFDSFSKEFINTHDYHQEKNRSFWFTSDKEEAKQYGNILYTCELYVSKLLQIEDIENNDKEEKLFNQKYPDKTFRLEGKDALIVQNFLEERGYQGFYFTKDECIIYCIFENKSDLIKIIKKEYHTLKYIDEMCKLAGIA